MSLYCHVDQFYFRGLDYNTNTRNSSQLLYEYRNTTSEATESICFDGLNVNGYETCENFRGTLDLDDFADLNDTQKEIYYSTAGCRICDDNTYPYVNWLENFGIHVNHCKAGTDIDR